MSAIAAIIFFLLLPAGIAAAVGAGLANLAPDWSLRRRCVIAALSAGLLPVLLPIAAILLTEASEVALPVTIMVILGLIIAALVGLPIALWAGRRSDRRNPPPAPERIFD